MKNKEIKEELMEDLFQQIYLHCNKLEEDEKCWYEWKEGYEQPKCYYEKCPIVKDILQLLYMFFGSSK